MIVMESVDGGKGLDWYGLPQRRKALITKYKNIYHGSGQQEKDYKDRTHISKIKKKLLAYRNTIANINSFLPSLDKGKNYSYYRINAQTDNIIIIR